MSALSNPVDSVGPVALAYKTSDFSLVLVWFALLEENYYLGVV